MATQYIYDMTDTWNDAGTLSGIKMVITNTLSGASSNILDLAITGGASVVVSKGGVLTLDSGAASLAISPVVATTRANLGLTIGTHVVGYGGALGTPTSGTLTSCTGLPPAGVTGTAAILGANTFTALQTITQASANAGIIASTGYSLTGSNATSMIDLAGTWNTTGTPTLIKANVTGTAYNAASLMIDLQTSGNTKFAIGMGAAYTAAGTLRLNANGGGPMAGVSPGGTAFIVTRQDSVTSLLDLYARHMVCSSAGNIGFWSTTNMNSGSMDTIFARSVAGTFSVEGASSALGFILHGLTVVNDTNGGSLAATDVRGQVYTNTGASGGQTFNLPAAVAGMWVTFYLSAADAVTINPDNADRILVLTNADGDAISCSTQGAFITLVAIDATNWCAISMNGTWTDAN